MEAKLRAMESRLHLDGGGEGEGGVAGPPSLVTVDESADSTIFSFSEGMPRAAAFNKGLAAKAAAQAAAGQDEGAAVVNGAGSPNGKA